MPRRPLNERLALALVPPLAALFIRVLGATLRYENIASPGTIPGDQIPGPAIFAFWHRSLLIAAHRFRGQRIAILISRSFDGELIARTVTRLGFLPVRGSSSRGGSSSLRTFTEAFYRGHICAFTADGPRGPAMVAKDGPMQLATLVNAQTVGAFYLLPARAWVLRSWDRFLIPKPFSRIVVTWPAHARGTAPGRPPETAAVQHALDSAVTMAEKATADIAT